MKALEFTAGLEVRLAEIPEPSIGASEVLLSIDVAAFCGTDPNTFRRRNRKDESAGGDWACVG